MMSDFINYIVKLNEDSIRLPAVMMATLVPHFPKENSDLLKLMILYIVAVFRWHYRNATHR